MLPPNAKLTCLVDAAVEPLDLASAKNYCRVEIGDDDALIGDLITAARQLCEGVTNRSYIATTWKLTLDYLPTGTNPFVGLPGAYATSLGCSIPWNRNADGSIELPRPPLIGVQSINYSNQSGQVAELDLSRVVVSAGTPGRIAPAFGSIFPYSLPQISAVNITYTAGYGADANAVPKTVKQAIRMMVAHWYHNRPDFDPMPQAVCDLLARTNWNF